MKTFLGMIMVFMVSGDDTTIIGVLEGSVLLPCTCLKLDKEFKWQMEEPNPMPMYKFNNTLSNRYKGRTKTFLTENRNNCSVLLTNITAEDQGEYKCIFRSDDTYQISIVHLNVSANYSVCQTKHSLSGGVNVFQCDVKGRYREAWIQWTLLGQPLTNLTETKMTHTNHTDARFYYFNSTLSTNLNWTSEPTCEVKAKHISTTLSSGCGVKFGKRVDPKIPRVRWSKIISVMMFGICLLSLFLKSSSMTQ